MSLLYSKQAALDVLKARKIFRVKRVKHSILVVWQNQQGKTCSGFVAKRLFYVRFNEIRDKAAEKLVVRQYISAPNWYSVEGKRIYRVIVNPGFAQCPCEDFNQQFKTWGKGYCKHLRAVGLYILGKSASFSELVGV